MALEIFKLVGSIFVDNSKANDSLSKTDSKAANVAKTLVKGAGTAVKWGSAIVGGATAAVGAVTAFTGKAAASCDTIDKMSQKLGISRTAYQELDYITSQNGMSVDTLQAGMKTLTSQMMKGSSALTALGVSATGANGELRSSEEVFYDSISALQGMTNETERNALASQLFGKSATELAPLLNSGADSMEALRQQAHDLGLVLGDDTIDAGVKLTDTIDNLKRSFGSIITQLGAEVMPLVQQVAEGIIAHMPEIQAMFGQLAPAISQLFGQLMPPLMDLAASLFPMIIDLLTTLIPPVAQIVQQLVPILVRLLEVLLPPIIQIVEKILPVLVELLEPILNLLGPILDLIQPILDLIVAILDPVITLLEVALKPLVDFMSTKLSVELKVVASLLRPIIDLFKGIADGAGQAFNTLKNIIKLPHFSISPAGWGVGDLFKGSIPKLGVEWYANGGIMNDPTAFGMNGGNVMVGGEAGPEAIAPIDTLKTYIAEAVGSSNTMLLAVMQDMFEMLREAMPELKNTQLVLDTGELIGATVEEYDAALGKLTTKKRRGV